MVRSFSVDSDHLLLIGENSGFDSGLSPLFDKYPMGLNLFLDQLIHNPLAHLIITHHTTKDSFSSESINIIHDIGGPPQTDIPMSHNNNRNSSFWGDTGNLSPDKSIHHDIADNQNPSFWKAVHCFSKCQLSLPLVQFFPSLRSEERRVGKECRSRW